MSEFDRIEDDLIHWFEWVMGAKSGGLGLPNSYDPRKIKGGGGHKYTPTSPDFPHTLRICDYALSTLSHKHFDALRAKYTLLDCTDTERAQHIGISKGEFSKRLDKAKDRMIGGYDMATVLRVRGMESVSVVV